MRSHQQLHRRQGAKEFFSAIKDAFDGEEQEETTTSKATTTTKAVVRATSAAEVTTTRAAVSIVYVTAEPTFEGPIGGYKTLGVDDEETTSAPTFASSKVEVKATTAPQASAAQTSIAPTKEASSIVVDTKEKTTQQQTTLSTSSTGLPSEISAPSTTLTSSVEVLAATGSVTRSSTSKKPSATQQSSLASSSASSTPEVSSGMSSGGKAGLAIGILLLVGAILAIALFVFKKRKDKAKKEEIENEKSTMFATSGRPASTKTNATAPQLSLRPVTEFLPNLGAKRSSQGNVLNTMAAATPNRAQTSPEQNRNNPFGNSAEIIDSNNANGPSPVQLNGPSGEVIVAAAALAPAGGLARGASKRVNGASPVDYTTKNAALGPPSPSGTEFSENSDINTTPTPSGTGAAIVAAGGPANTAVHRVQLDFKPSMEDELELRAGQLVRVLHEYDDGWALCIRLDRSQQGVAPRTCLSTRPVKPRPQQQQQQGQRISPTNQGQRGPGPQGQMRTNSPGMNGGSPVNGNRGSPQMAQGRRPGSGESGRNSPGPQYNGQRPSTPQGQGRPMTPQGQGSTAMNQQGQRNSPPQGPSPMNLQTNNSQPMPSSPPVGRKAVPGQAM